MPVQFIAGAVLWILAIMMLLLLITYALFFSVSYKAKMMSVESTLSKPEWEPYRAYVEHEIAWYDQQEKKQLYILTRDKVRLSAWYMPAEGESRGRVILMHDYRTPAVVNFAGVIRSYHDKGYDVLLCDQRAHGESLGKFICFGARERYDCKLWIDCINKVYGADKPIILHGVGMGGTTVLMTAGLSLPKNVTAVIAESAYTSPYVAVKKLLKRRHLGPEVILRYFSFWCSGQAGYKLKGSSTQAALRETKLPILLVHGSEDAMAPVGMAQDNYEACTAEKQLCVVPGAGHGVCRFAAEQCGVDVLSFAGRHEELPAAEEEASAEAENAESSEDAERADGAEAAENSANE